MGRKFKIKNILLRVNLVLLLWLLIPFTNISTSFSHDNHGNMIEALEPYPTIQVNIKNFNVSDYKINFKIDNFELAPIGQISESQANVGHILLLINNKKKIMITEKTFILKKNLLRKGKNELFIMLMTTDHSLYTLDEDIIYVSKRIYVE